MLGEAMYTTIETLMKQGLNKSQIARATKHDWKTVDKVIKRILSVPSQPLIIISEKSSQINIKNKIF